MVVVVQWWWLVVVMVVGVKWINQHLFWPHPSGGVRPSAPPCHPGWG